MPPGNWTWSDLVVEPEFSVVDIREGEVEFSVPLASEFDIAEMSDTKVQIKRKAQVTVDLSTPEMAVTDVTKNHIHQDQLHGTSPLDFCLDRRCKHNAYGTHFKHAKNASKIYFGGVWDIWSLPREVRNNRYNYEGKHICHSCDTNLIPTDHDGSFCNHCISKDFSHDFQDEEEVLEYDEREILRSIGYSSRQYFNEACSCTMCWEYRSEYSLREPDSLMDENGERITTPSYEHENIPPTYSGMCSECGKGAGHHYHTLNEDDRKIGLWG